MRGDNSITTSSLAGIQKGRERLPKYRKKWSNFRTKNVRFTVVPLLRSSCQHQSSATEIAHLMKYARKGKRKGRDRERERRKQCRIKSQNNNKKKK